MISAVCAAREEYVDVRREEAGGGAEQEVAAQGVMLIMPCSV